MQLSSRSLAISVVAGCVLVGVIAWWSMGRRQRNVFLDSLRPGSPSPVVNEATRKRIAAFCGDCHALPQPQNFPREQWHHEVALGYEFYARSGRRDLDPPPMEAVVHYYRALAPEQLIFPEPEFATEKLRATFTSEKLDWHEGTYVLPAVAYLSWMEAPWSKKSELFVCDMRDGSVSAIDIRARPVRRRVIAHLDHPCHIEPGDLDGDGAVDWVVAELGSMYPDDHDRGKVVSLRWDPLTDSFSETVIAEGLGRVSDARPSDLDGDGDSDLVVAEFGHFRTGCILLLENESERNGQLRFEKSVLDRRPGTIHVPIHDFNEDGRPDFAALVSQEYERLEIFVNQQQAKFHLHPLWAAPDLTFGCSGLEVVDLDQDGDVDLVFTNGDTFDNSYANPSHGVNWLENRGRMQFAYHRLVDMPGAYRALPADVDLDGDLDLLVVAFLRASAKPASLRSPSTASIVCLEQTERGQYVRHVLEAGVPRHPSLAVGDFDGDGDFDFAVGSFAFPPQSPSENEKSPPRLAIWWNQLRP